MTHAWMEITSGRWDRNNGGQHNLDLVANMLCEIVGFEFLFRHVFGNENLPLEGMPQEMASSGNTQRVQSDRWPLAAPLVPN